MKKEQVGNADIRMKKPPYARMDLRVQGINACISIQRQTKETQVKEIQAKDIRKKEFQDIQVIEIQVKEIRAKEIIF